MFKVYWTDFRGASNGLEIDDLVKALAFTEDVRKRGATFITMASENPNQVGKSGVASIEEGKTPQGTDYTWSKQGRAGKPKRKDTLITEDNH
jgi:hypothetical protein